MEFNAYSLRISGQKILMMEKIKFVATERGG